MQPKSKNKKIQSKIRIILIGVKNALKIQLKQIRIPQLMFIRKIMEKQRDYFLIKFIYPP